MINLINRYSHVSYIIKYKKFLIISQNLNEKFISYMTVFVIINILIVKFLNLYFSSQILYNIDDLILVFNNIKGL